MKTRHKILLGLGITIMLILIVELYPRKYTEKLYLENQDLYIINLQGKEIKLLENIVDYKLTNLEEDTENLIVLETNEKLQKSDNILIGNWIKFYKIHRNNSNVELELIYENDFTRVKPWSINAGKLDKDDKKDIFVGAYRATDYYELDKRPFFFNWNGKILTRKWTGSYLGFNKLQSVEFEDINKDGIDEVKALEIDEEGVLKYGYYAWTSFNFTKLGEIDAD